MPEGKGISGTAIAIVFAGSILAYSGLKGWKLTMVTQDILSGKDPRLDPRVESSALTVSPGGLFGGLLSNLNPINLLASSGGGVTSTGGAVSGTAAQNKALGQKMAAAVGWTGDQWTAFNNVIMAESGWNANAANPTSDARGIGQKISGWSSNYQPGNAAQQIAWTIAYIQTRYKTPEAAWEHEQQFHWY